MWLFFVFYYNKHYNSGINMITTVIGHLNLFIFQILSGISVCVLRGGEQLLTRCARADNQHFLTSQFISR